jgi:hypothetical protein
MIRLPSRLRRQLSRGFPDIVRLIRPGIVRFTSSYVAALSDTCRALSPCPQISEYFCTRRWGTGTLPIRSRFVA